MYFAPRAKTPYRINRLMRGNGAYIIRNEFCWERERTVFIREDLDSSFPFVHCCSRAMPHRLPHCSVGQSRPRLRRACGIARGARAFSSDRRDGPIRPNSHEFATEQAVERCRRPRGYKKGSWNDARGEERRERGKGVSERTREKKRGRKRAHDGETKKGKKNPRAVSTSRFDLRGKVRSEWKESGYRQPSEASYRNVHSTSMYPFGNAKVAYEKCFRYLFLFS